MAGEQVGMFLSSSIKLMSAHKRLYTLPYNIESLSFQVHCLCSQPDVIVYVTYSSPSPCVFPPALLLMVGLMLYPAGWGSEKVIGYCGTDASPYKPAQCSLGWAFYAAIGGTLAAFLCAVFSAQAEIATSSDKVQEEIEEGKSLICLLWAWGWGLGNTGDSSGDSFLS